MPDHDEWTKCLPDGTTVRYVYDGVADVYAASVEFVGQDFRSSRTNLRRPLTRAQVEALFVRETHQTPRDVSP